MAQLIISVAGAAAGFAIGGPQGALIGYQIGSTVGAAFAPAQKVSGPKITDGKITGTEYGQPLRYIDGQDRHAGQLVWASKVRPIKNTTEQGGKGGGVKSTTYTYQVDLLYVVSDVEIAGVPRCWVNGKLVRNLLATADAATLQASTQSEYWSDFLVYPGNYTQLPDPTYEADKGVGSTPALRGRGYVLLKDFELGSSINIPNISFEVVTALTPGFNASQALIWSSSVGNITTPSFNPAGYEFGQRLSGQIDYYRVTQSGKVKFSRSEAVSNGYTLLIGASDVDCTVLAADEESFEVRYSSGRTAYFFYAGGLSRSIRFAIRGDTLVARLDVAGGLIARFSADGGFPLASLTGLTSIAMVEIVADKCYAYNLTTGDHTEIDLASMAVIQTIGPPATGGAPFSSDTGELYYASAGDQIYKLVGSSFVLLGGGPGAISLASISVGTQATMVGNVLYNFTLPGVGIDMYAIIVNPTMVPDSPLLPDVVSRLCLRASPDLAGQFDVSALPATPVLGVGLGQVGPVRQALELLAQAYFFSLRNSDKLYFFPTFTAPVATIPFEDLGASANGEAEPLSIKTLADLEKPTHVALSYANVDAAYNTGTAYPNGRLATQDSTSAAALPLVLTSTEAQAIVDTTQQDSIAYLFDTRLSLTHQYARLEPGDLVNVVARNGNVYALRLGKRTEAAGVITFECRSHDSSVVVTAGVDGGTYTAPGAVVALPYTDAEYMDCPLLQDADDGVPVLYAAVQGTAAGWPGAALYGGFDAANLEQISIATVASVFGTTTSAPADYTRGNVFDEVSTFNVDVGSGELVSVTSDQMLDSQANAALVGSEVLQFRTSTLISAGKYTLSGLLRGRLGTEWAQTGHASGERFVMLSPSALRRIALTTTQLDAERVYRAVTLGRALSTGDDEPVTCTGVSLKPWAPVAPRVSRPINAGPAVLLHMDGTNGSTTFTDSSVNAFAFTAAGNAQISTAQSKFGGASGLFDGAGDYISRAHNAAFDVSTGDFTVECWVRPNSVGAQQVFMSKTTGAGDAPFYLYLTAGGLIGFLGDNTSGTTVYNLTSLSAVTTGVWYHVAGVREGSTFRLYVDGVQQGTASTAVALMSNSGHPLVVGGLNNGTQSLNGNLDDVALWKGTAVYPGGTTFTPPAAAIPNPGSDTGNVTIEWDRRTRLRTNPTNGYVPLGEASEAYEVVVYTSSSYATPVRTVTGLTSASWEYTLAEQVADFGTQQSTVYADIFQVSAIVGRGYPLRGAF